MESNKPTTAYILSLIGGLITFITGIVGAVWFGAGGPGWGGFGGWMGGMMGTAHVITGGGEFGFFRGVELFG